MRFINRIVALFKRPEYKRLSRYVEKDKLRSSGELYWTGAELRMMAKCAKLAQVCRKAGGSV